MKKILVLLMLVVFTGALFAAGGAETPKAKPKLKMFASDSGAAYPAGVDPSDNEYIKVIEDYAGVDLEIEVPAYMDFVTKFNLLLASGNLPDVVHSWVIADAIKAGMNGAFIDLKKYFDKSPVVQKYITPAVFDLTRADDGKYYRIPMTTYNQPNGNGNYVRWDLLTQYNGGKFPDSVEGYVDFLKWVKKTFPDSLPLTARNNPTKFMLYAEVFFYWFGAMPQSYNVVGGKVTSTFLLPQYKAAVALYRQLYTDGILDKEFATNQAAQWSAKLFGSNVAMSSTYAAAMLSYNNSLITLSGKKDATFVFTPNLTKYPDVVKNVEYTYGLKQTPTNFHGLYIPTQAKTPDLSWKVIEGFATDKFIEKIVWGNEGREYKTVNGKKVVDAAVMGNKDRNYVLGLMLITGQGPREDITREMAKGTLGEERVNLIVNSLKVLESNANIRGYALMDAYRFTSGLMNEPAAVTAKKDEQDMFIAEASAQAIMGKISMEDFDKKVEEYRTRYGFIGDEWTKVMNLKKDAYRAAGAKEVDR